MKALVGLAPTSPTDLRAVSFLPTNTTMLKSTVSVRSTESNFSTSLRGFSGSQHPFRVAGFELRPASHLGGGAGCRHRQNEISEISACAPKAAVLDRRCEVIVIFKWIT
jgi:hypothetical protein